MCREQIILSNDKKIFRDHPVQSKHNKPISGYIHSTKNFPYSLLGLELYSV